MYLLLPKVSSLPIKARYQRWVSNETWKGKTGREDEKERERERERENRGGDENFKDYFD